MMRLLDADEHADTFRQYRNSSNFKANHHETFKNTKDKPGYFFGG